MVVVVVGGTVVVVVVVVVGGALVVVVVVGGTVVVVVVVPPPDFLAWVVVVELAPDVDLVLDVTGVVADEVVVVVVGGTVVVVVVIGGKGTSACLGWVVAVADAVGDFAFPDPTNRYAATATPANTTIPAPMPASSLRLP